MDLTKVLAQLRLELDHIDAAIISLERLQATESRRGRPPKAMLQLRKAKPAAHPPVRGARRAQRGRNA